jgi:hypothetical protein
MSSYCCVFTGSKYEHVSNQNYYRIVVVMSLIAVVMYISPLEQAVM